MNVNTLKSLLKIWYKTIDTTLFLVLDKGSMKRKWKKQMKGSMERDESKIVEIFTDGACSGNPGPGGYGILLRYEKKVKEISGYCPNTTNNRMELMAVIEGLKTLTRPSRVRLVTDSRYVYQGITTWIYAWLKKNWLNSQKKPVLNRDLWEELLTVSKPHQIEWQWIKGHSQHPENERCDFLARHAIRENLKR